MELLLDIISILAHQRPQTLGKTFSRSVPPEPFTIFDTTQIPQRLISPEVLTDLRGHSETAHGLELVTDRDYHLGLVVGVRVISGVSAMQLIRQRLIRMCLAQCRRKRLLILFAKSSNV